MTNATGADRAIRAAQVRHFVLVRRRFPKWLRVVWVSVCCLFVVSELVMTPFGLPSISSLLLQWTGEYQPVRWLVGNLTGFVLLYTLALLWRLNVLKWKLARGAGAFVGFLAKVPVWVFDILFYGALATGVVEVLLIATNTGTVSRFFFDWAQGFALLY
ncbi:MAG: hypothetical protein IH851_10655 [Armatimonadetes bacterium]|nr:hypothetical protein [Armatimonadota bacterium]